MRILQTLHWIQFAGTEKVCVDLCNEMSKEHEVILLSDLKIKKYLNEKVNVIKFDFEQNRYNPLFLYKTSQLLKKIDPDIIQCHNTKEIEIIHYAQFFLNKKIPIVATRHNAEYKKKYSYADIGIAVSKETMDYMSAKKNIYIQNGVSRVTPKYIEMGDKFSIVGVGRLAKVKGWDLLLNALAKVNFDFKLLIIGEGNQKDELTNLAKELNIDKKVNFVGFINNVADYVYSCDLQVICSQTEGLSLSLIEAIFYAKVLVASNVSNHKDLLGQELVYDRNIDDLANKLNQIYENYDKFVEIFTKIKEKKDDFGVERMSQKYIEVYKSLL